MPRIDIDEEFSQDWDWYACDELGNIGHFTTAGFRPLPESVKSDREALITLIEYFDGRHEMSAFSISQWVEKDIEQSKGTPPRETYLRSFAAADKRGLFSYDNDLWSDIRSQVLHSHDTPLSGSRR